MSKEIIDNEFLEDPSNLSKLSDFQLIGIIEEEKRYDPILISAIKSELQKRALSTNQQIALRAKYKDSQINSKYKISKLLILALVILLLLTFTRSGMTQVYIILIVTGSILAIRFRKR